MSIIEKNAIKVAFESLDSLMVVATLMFGFGVSVWFGVGALDPTSFGDGDGEHALYVCYCMLLAAAIGLAGSSTAVLAGHQHHVKLLFVNGSLPELRRYTDETEGARAFTRWALFLSMISFFLAMMVYGGAMIGVDEAYQAISTSGSMLVLLACGVITAFYVRSATKRKLSLK